MDEQMNPSTSVLTSGLLIIIAIYYLWILLPQQATFGLVRRDNQIIKQFTGPIRAEKEDKKL